MFFAASARRAAPVSRPSRPRSARMESAPPADGESLYATLGVEPTASSETVRKAYRKLVLKCHPDKVRDAAAKPEAERLFRLIVTAYEVLSDDVKRAEYDKRARLNGADVDDVLVNVTLKEALTGATKLAMVLDKKKCAACVGVGMRCESCATCAGRRVDANGKPCAACGGRGFGAPKPCAACHSKGAVEDFFQGRVAVPAGVADGARVRVAGKKQRAKIRIMPSKLFERDGLVIRSVLKLTAAQAKEGGFFDVETLGGVATVFVDAGAKTGDAATVRGAGLPAAPGEPSGPRGDHVARVEVAAETSRETNETNKTNETNEKDGSSERRELPGDERGKLDDDARDAKRRKSEAPAAAAPDATDLAALLAAKKRALIEALEAKAAGGSGGG